MSQIVWLPEALEDATRLRDFLLEKSPDAARRMADTLRSGAKMLSDFPAIGKPMNDGTSRRELFLSFGTGGYVLRYRLDREIVVILRVWHGREDRQG